MAEEYNYPAKPDFYIWDQSVPGETPVLKNYKDTPYYQTWLQKLKEEKDELDALTPALDCDTKPTRAEKLSCCNEKATSCAKIWAEWAEVFHDLSKTEQEIDAARNRYHEQRNTLGCRSTFGESAAPAPEPSWWCYGWDPYDFFDTYAKCQLDAHENKLKGICKMTYGKDGGAGAGGGTPVTVSILSPEIKSSASSLINSNPKVLYIPTDGASRLNPGYI